jgi:hypothetical protein
MLRVALRLPSALGSANPELLPWLQKRLAVGTLQHGEIAWRAALHGCCSALPFHRGKTPRSNDFVLQQQGGKAQSRYFLAKHVHMVRICDKSCSLGRPTELGVRCKRLS